MTGSLLAFMVVAGLLTLTPGADTALVIRQTLQAGRRAGARTALGVSSGVLIWGAGSALGVSALVEASPLAYDLLRYAGAGYLLYLGVGSLRRARSGGAAAAPAGPPSRPFRTGLVTNLLNPKIGVFYATLLPAFVPPGQPVLATSLLLAGTHAAMGTAWLNGIAGVTARAAQTLRRDAWRHRLEAVTGVVLVAFGVRVLAAGR